MNFGSGLCNFCLVEFGYAACPPFGDSGISTVDFGGCVSLKSSREAQAQG
jgi:hypothetical protein